MLKRFFNPRSVANSPTGAVFWLRPAIFFAVALAIIPPVWLIVLHWAGIPIGNTGGLLALIGGVMGAIFTAGGLIIALVSVYTQLSIEDRIKHSFDELQPQLDARASRQIEAYVAFQRMHDTQDWHEMLSLGQEALDKWPDMNGVRSYVGERLANEIETWFVSQVLGARSQFESTTFTSYASSPFASYLIPPQPHQAPIVFEPEENLPTQEALNWLENAIKHKEGLASQLAAYIALIYGFLGRFDKTMVDVRKAVGADEGMRNFLTAPTRLAMLAYACRRVDQIGARLSQLSELLGTPLPAGTQEVTNSLVSREIPESLGHNSTEVIWIAIEKPQGKPASSMGSLVSLHLRVWQEPEGKTCTAKWTAYQPYDIPTQPSWLPSSPNRLPIPDLVEQLDKQFWFICERKFWVPDA